MERPEWASLLRRWWRHCSSGFTRRAISGYVRHALCKPRRHRSASARRHIRRIGRWSFEPLEPRRVMAGEVLISEIMYHAASQDQRDEFIELYNPGSAPINLG